MTDQATRSPTMNPEARDPKVHARRWKTLVVLSVSLLIIGLDNTVLNVALPTLQTHFSASGSTLQWIVDSYLLAFAGVLLTMGTLGDRFGRKLALQSGLALFGVASVLAAFAQNADQLIALRAAMGIGGAMVMPAALSVVMDIFPPEERAKAIGIWSAIAGVGIGLGPFVGGLLLEWFSWSSVFWLNVPIVAWERRVASPMLPLSFFRNPNFTVASLAVGLVFFAMMGSVFAFTQYLQFAHGYSALEAGAMMVPLALGLVVGSGGSNALVGRF